jgi:hypothetical protein
MRWQREDQTSKAARYAGYSPDHFRRLAVEQHLIPFARPSGQQKGKILFRKTDLDRCLVKTRTSNPSSQVAEKSKHFRSGKPMPFNRHYLTLTRSSPNLK